MLWTYGNIEARIWPLDHCPPHVTFVCRPDSWTARIQFSMVADEVRLIDIKPLVHAPNRKLISVLADQVYANRLICRSSWWLTQKTACLDNKCVQRVGAGVVELTNESNPKPTDGVIVKNTGTYQAGVGVVATVIWQGSANTIEILREV